MARAIAKYTVSAEGRDKGNTYIITEMPPRAGHAWACRALFALGAAGADLGNIDVSAGMAGVAAVGFQAFIGGISADAALPLLDELMTCVTVNHGAAERALVDSDIEEIMTIFSLQKEVFMLHAAPFTRGVPSTSESAATPATAG